MTLKNLAYFFNMCNIKTHVVKNIFLILEHHLTFLYYKQFNYVLTKTNQI